MSNISCLICCNSLFFENKDNKDEPYCNVCETGVCKDCYDESTIYRQECPCGKKFLETSINRLPKGLITELKKELEKDTEYKISDLKQEIIDLRNKDKSKEKLNKIFTELDEKILLKCPYCNISFDDYDGCNAITCINCTKEFCAICFKKCDDAHQHIHTEHGSNNLFNKKLFIKYKNTHIKTMLDRECEKHSDEIKNIILARYINKEKIILDIDLCKIRHFIEEQKECLTKLIEDKKENCKKENLYLSNYDTLRFMLVIKDNEYIYYIIEKKKEINIQKDNGDIETKIYWERIKDDKELTEDEKKIYETFTSYKNDGSHAIIQFNNNEYIEIVNYKLVGNVHDFDEYYDQDERGMIIKKIMTYARQANNLYLINKYNSERLLLDFCKQFKPIVSYIGSKKPEPLIDYEIIDKPNYDVNEYQTKMLDLSNLHDINVYYGPPGTGKSYTITLFILELLKNTNYDIIILSEKNGAIDAIMNKFYNMIYNDEKFNEELWSNIISFGSNSASEKVSNFFEENKILNHPIIFKLDSTINRLNSECMKLTNKIDIHKLILVAIINNNSTKIKYFINKNKELITEEIKIRRNIMESNSSILEEEGFSHFNMDFDKDDLKKLKINTDDFSKILKNKRLFEKEINDFLIEKNIPKILYKQYKDLQEDEKIMEYNDFFVSKEYLIKIKKIIKILIESFDDIYKILELKEESIKIIDEKDKLTNKLKKELQEKNMRIYLSTIGSISKILSFINYRDTDRDTIIITDESSTIPSYDIFNMCLFTKCNIKGLVIVGDPNQLPPHEKLVTKAENGRFIKEENIPSLFDKLDIDVNRNHLKVQYRMQKDVADVLNHHIYKGKFETNNDVKLFGKGIEFINVQKQYIPNRTKPINYNYNEIDKVFELYKIYKHKKVMILSPYKDQISIIKKKFKEQHHNSDLVMTIDGSQGQECDITILTLVRDIPTIFLNKNRLNVALTRAKEKTIIVSNTSGLSKHKNTTVKKIFSDLIRL